MSDAEDWDRDDNELQQGWLAKYGDEWEADADSLERHGIARIPFNFLVMNENDAAVVVAAIQLRNDTAARIRKQAEELARKAERDAQRIQERFEMQLKEWTRTQLTGKAKSVQIATGQGHGVTRMGFRKVNGGLRIVDKVAATVWAENNSETNLLQTQVIVTPVAEHFKDYYTATGEVPPGCEVKNDEDRFYIREGKDDECA